MDGGDEVTWIYFALIDGENIKIGKADDVPKRMQQHAKTQVSRHDVKLLATVQGCAADERHVQRYFDEDAIESLRPATNGCAENFRASPTLTNYIRWLRNQWFTVIDFDDELPEGGVTFDVWGPAQDRQSSPVAHPLFPPDWLEFGERVITGDDYYTNPVVLECARKALGAIDLDPASHPLANKYVKATTFFSFNDNGLNQRWGGRVWLNPPFSQWKLWVPKIVEEWHSGRVQSMCVYSAMRTITAQYFRKLLDVSMAMCIITGRMKHGGKGGDSPDDGHCVFYFGSDVAKFVEEFSPIGSCWKSATQ